MMRLYLSILLMFYFDVLTALHISRNTSLVIICTWLCNVWYCNNINSNFINTASHDLYQTIKMKNVFRVTDDVFVFGKCMAFRNLYNFWYM